MRFIKEILSVQSVLLLLSAFGLSRTAAEEDCACVPTAYTWNLNFDLGCIDTNVTAAIIDESCTLPSETAVTVTSYEIYELDNESLAPIEESRVVANDQTLLNGDSITYTSITATETSPLPLGMQWEIEGLTITGDQVKATLVVRFDAPNCDTIIFEDGNTFGWLEFVELDDPNPAVCDALLSDAPSSTPTFSPSVADTSSPSYSPSMAPPTADTPSPSYSPSMAPSTADTPSPSLSPSVEPLTASPTLSPSMAPSTTLSPSMAPSTADIITSSSPSMAPSTADTPITSSAPSTEEVDSESSSKKSKGQKASKSTSKSKSKGKSSKSHKSKGSTSATKSSSSGKSSKSRKRRHQ